VEICLKKLTFGKPRKRYQEYVLRMEQKSPLVGFVTVRVQPSGSATMVSPTLSNPSSRIRPWGFTQSLTEISTRSRKEMFLENIAWPARKADNLIVMLEPTV
jgi:hypothetical protein